MFEQLFNSSVLDVTIPDTSLEYPPLGDHDEWLARLRDGTVERRQAFFDEQLQFFLTLRVDHEGGQEAPTDPKHPPAELLSFLSHVQVSFEASYISPTPSPLTPQTPNSTFLSAPLRGGPFGKLKPRPGASHPSIFPSSTPNPTPSSAGNDRKYAQSEGTLLSASIWGQNTSDESFDAFSLLWSQRDQVWVAIYRLSVTISFLKMNVSEPLLCLTVSATLREKPLNMTQPKHPLALFLESMGALPVEKEPSSPIPTNGQSEAELEDDGGLHGLEEVNLLDGLSAGPSFGASKRVILPSTRLGAVTRRQVFSLPPAVPPTPNIPSPSPLTFARATHPTLRKSYRKTIHTVSGFRVRMRTVFVPYVLLPESPGEEEVDEVESERERREAGNEERTVVLCVEIENSGESGPGIGFSVEALSVKIGGDGAKATLIGWGESAFSQESEKGVFPLLIGSMEQYNLLYAVSFLRSPNDTDGLSLSNIGSAKGGPSESELQRAVTIVIDGKPYLTRSKRRELLAGNTAEPLSYPTQSFSSRWNCVLDLSAQQTRDTFEAEFAEGFEVLPEPASPFPTTSPRTAGLKTPITAPPASSIAGSKRHTLAGTTVPGRPPHTAAPMNNRSSTPVINPSKSIRDLKTPTIPSKLSINTPSISVQTPHSMTTYGPPSSIAVDGETTSSDSHENNFAPPMTPAYPAYPAQSTLASSPQSQVPIASYQLGSVGPSVEIRRERGVIMGLGTGGGIPQTPGPLIAGGFGEQGILGNFQHRDQTNESVVVSVGLLTLPISHSPRRHSQQDAKAMSKAPGPGKIYPLDTFTLDIFVFNQSSWTRRFEVSCPDQRRRRRRDRDERISEYYHESDIKKNDGKPGILPLDNRVRVGPLLPSTCQSVRMDFLAINPGVHSVDILSLTDVVTGFSMNLRSVMDVVVHEPNVSGPEPT